MLYRPMSMPYTGSVTNSASDILLGPRNSLSHWPTTRHQGSNSSRECATGTVGMGSDDAFGPQLNNVFSVKVDINWFGCAMSSLDNDMMRSLGMNSACSI